MIVPQPKDLTPADTSSYDKPALAEAIRAYHDRVDEIVMPIDPAEAEVAVEVNNAHDPSIPPLSVGYALYGGIYRDVYLWSRAPIHVRDFENRTNLDTAYPDATLETSVSVRNSGRTRASVGVTLEIFDAAGKEEEAD